MFPMTVAMIISAASFKGLRGYRRVNCTNAFSMEFQRRNSNDRP